MEILQLSDRKDYTDDMPVFEKYSVRGIIRRDGRFAVQEGALGDCKLLGGGVDEGESYVQALEREVREESGLLVIPESVREIGEVLERRRDLYDPTKVYICHSCYFTCEVRSEMTEPSMTTSEIARGYHLSWLTAEEIIRKNATFSEVWIRRDTDFIRRLPEYEARIGKSAGQS